MNTASEPSDETPLHIIRRFTQCLRNEHSEAWDSSKYLEMTASYFFFTSARTKKLNEAPIQNLSARKRRCTVCS